MHFVEERAIFILGREGFYPKIGSLTTGSGFAYGAGYRDRDLFNNTGHGGSVGRDQPPPVLGHRGAPHVSDKLANKRLLVETWAAHRDYPQEDFFGIGPRLGSRRPDQLRHPNRISSARASASVLCRSSWPVVASSI